MKKFMFILVLVSITLFVGQAMAEGDKNRTNSPIFEGNVITVPPGFIINEDLCTELATSPDQSGQVWLCGGNVVVFQEGS